MRKLLALLVLAVVAMTGGSTRHVPSQAAESVIVEFLAIDSAYTAAACATWHRTLNTQEVSCADKAAIFYVDVDWVVTHIGVSVGVASVWTANEACDVDIDIGGTTAATFNVGDTGLAAAGDVSSTTVLSVTSVDAGGAIIVRHDDPIGDTCLAGSSCDCDSANASHRVTVYGYKP